MEEKNNSQSSENYDLKSAAVEKLVQAQSGESEQYTQEELNRYTTKKGFSIPTWLKIVLIKAWFAGAVCFFILWGLGNYLKAMLDMMFAVAVVYGMVTDLMVNNILRFLEKTPGEHNKWMLVTHRGMVGFGLNLLLGFVVIFCVYVTYSLLNYTIMSATGNFDILPIGVEPLLFGLLCMGYDMLLIGMKRLLAGLIRDARAAGNSRA